MTDGGDAVWMDRAFALAERGRGRTTPNPIVGAVVVTPDGVVVGQGAHLEAGGPHAEVYALEMAGERAKGATLYCTLEPCSHTGRTGPCAERVADAGISRVVVATRDPNPRVSGRGLGLLRQAGVVVVEGPGRERALRLNRPFFTWVTAHRPFVTLKVALSQDGLVGRAGERVALTGPEANRFFHRQRAEVDALAVGAGTVRNDDPLLTARGAYRYRPLTRVIFDWHLAVPPGARVFSTLEAGPVIMIVGDEAAGRSPDTVAGLESRGIRVERVPDRGVREVLTRLAGLEIVSLLVEGGPRLHEAFVASGCVDRLQWAFTPRELGHGVGIDHDWGRDLRVELPPRVTRLGPDVLVEADVHGTD